MTVVRQFSRFVSGSVQLVTQGNTTRTMDASGKTVAKSTTSGNTTTHKDTSGRTIGKTVTK